jgi:hypothetical protein
MLGMSMSMGMTQRQEQRMSLSQRQVQRLGQSLQMTLNIIEAVRGLKYSPEATCPGCTRKLNPAEIMMGFNDDVNDFTTECTNCGRRFEPKLMHYFQGGTGRSELPFYCSSQTLAMMGKFKDSSPEEIQKKNPGMYHSAIVHYGTLRRAFREANIEYSFEELIDWKVKIVPFLGKLQDTKIASILDVPVREIRKMRKERGIRPFKR